MIDASSATDAARLTNSYKVDQENLIGEVKIIESDQNLKYFLLLSLLSLHPTTLVPPCRRAVALQSDSTKYSETVLVSCLKTVEQKVRVPALNIVNFI